MSQRDHDHEAGGPAVHAADERAGSHRTLHECDAVVRMIGRRRIERRQHGPGHHLYKEDGQRRATQGMPPRQSVGHLAIEQRTTKALEVDPFVQPAARTHRQVSTCSAIPIL